MPLRPRKPCLKESDNQFLGHLNSRYAAAETQQIHIVIFHALMSGVILVNKCSPDPGNFVGRNGGADAASANGNSALYLSRCHRPCQGYDKIWVVVTLI